MGILWEIIKLVVLLVVYIPYKLRKFISVGYVTPSRTKKSSRPAPPQGRKSKRVYYVSTEKSWGLIHSPTSDLAVKTLRKHYGDYSPLVRCRYATMSDIVREESCANERLVADK